MGVVDDKYFEAKINSILAEIAELESQIKKLRKRKENKSHSHVVADITDFSGGSGGDSAISVGPDNDKLGSVNSQNYPRMGQTDGDIPEGWKLAKVKLVRFEGDDTIWGLPLYAAHNQPTLAITWPVE